MRVALTLVSTGLISLALSTTAVAQATADNAGGVYNEPVYIQTQGGSQSNTDALTLLLDQFRAMRSELETLRGMVEEQAYQIRRMQRDSMDRYSDLDSRISALYQELETGEMAARQAGQSQGAQPSQAQGDASPARPGQVGTSQAAQARNGTDGQMPAADIEADRPGSPAEAMRQSGAGVGDPLPDPSRLSEQQLYQSALDVLLLQERYQRSIDEFNQYLNEYPDGRYVTNAYYWQGQAYINLSMLDEARRAFETIVNDYPDGRKIEDAMYSLGTVYNRLGDTQRARDLLRQVMTRFPNTSAANLADLYLRSLN